MVSRVLRTLHTWFNFFRFGTEKNKIKFCLLRDLQTNFANGVKWIFKWVCINRIWIDWIISQTKSNVYLKLIDYKYATGFFVRNVFPQSDSAGCRNHKSAALEFKLEILVLFTLNRFFSIAHWYTWICIHVGCVRIFYHNIHYISSRTYSLV